MAPLWAAGAMGGAPTVSCAYKAHGSALARCHQCQNRRLFRFDMSYTMYTSLSYHYVLLMVI